MKQSEVEPNVLDIAGFVQTIVECENAKLRAKALADLQKMIFRADGEDERFSFLLVAMCEAQYQALEKPERKSLYKDSLKKWLDFKALQTK
jgi:hypothetical protein